MHSIDQAAAAAVQAALSQLREQWPSMLALRLDHDTLGQSAVPVLRLHALMEGAKPTRPSHMLHLYCSASRGWAGNPALARELEAMTPTAPVEVIAKALDALFEHEPFGAWALRPTPTMQPRTVQLHPDANDLQGWTPEGFAYALKLVDELFDVLPHIHQIEADQVPEREHRGTIQERTHLRFIDRSGTTCAHVDASMLRMHLREVMRPHSEQHARLNSNRQSAWAKRWRLQVTEMPLVLHSLELIFCTLRIDAVGRGA